VGGENAPTSVEGIGALRMCEAIGVKKPKHMTSIGGQALIEGLMMIGPKNAAIAIRKPDGEIVVEKGRFLKKAEYRNFR